MAEKLFSISCETCGSRIAVRDVNLIGHILSCPKCSSMVMVQPPEDWTPPDADAPANAPNNAPASAATTNGSSSGSVADAAADAPTSLSPTTASETAALRDRWAEAASVAAPPPVNPQAIDPEAATASANVPLRGEDWMTPRQRWMRRYLPKIGAAVGGVAATVTLWYAFSGNGAVVDGSPTTAESTDQAGDPHGNSDDLAAEDDNPPRDATSTALRAPEPDDEIPAEVLHREVPISLPVAVEPPPVERDANAPADDKSTDVVAAAPDAAAQRPERDSLPVIDIAARLNDPILKLTYVRTPLVEYLRVLSTMSTIPITLDVDALIDAGIRPETPLSIRAEKTTVGEALNLALAKLKLRYLVVDQQVIVTTAESGDSGPPARREIGDLVGTEAGEAERLRTAIERLIEPMSWRTQRTTTSLRVGGTALVVVQSPRVMRKIDALLAALRAARRDPIGVAVSPPPELQTRRVAAREALSKKITLNYTAATPLEKILTRLEESSKLTILVDWQALAGEDVGPVTLARMSATDVTVERAFEALVEPLFLSFRAIDETTIEITTQDGLAGKPELAAYPLADLAADAAAYAAITDKVRSHFGPAAAVEAATTIDGGVAWYVDEPSKTLLLLAPQDLHVELAEFLRGLRESHR
ncbi:MAG: hypothetical protein WD875_00115 [Pirellulales bacterium]